MQLTRVFTTPLLSSRVFHKDALSPLVDFTNIEHWWEMRSVFNPGVALKNDLFYLLYRAQDFHFISRFGLAVFDPKKNKIIERSELPVFELSSQKDLKDGRIGCEDPRIIYSKEEKRWDVVYTQATIKPITKLHANILKKSHPYGWYDVYTRHMSTKDFTSFHRENFLLHKEEMKDVAIFPQKIQGMYAILLRMVPSIQLAFSPNLQDIEPHLDLIKPRTGFWDSTKVGIGSPPIWTPKGWLCIYHGVDHKNVYRLGYFILDLTDVSKVLYRSHDPILEPKLSWEKEGNTPNVVFTNGAEVYKDDVYVFYGAADKVIGLAKAPLKEFLNVV